MNAGETLEITEVVQRVQAWPPPMRIALARQILQTLESLPGQLPAFNLPRGPLAAEIAANFKNDNPAPDDNTVSQWIEDYRVEQYTK